MAACATLARLAGGAWLLFDSLAPAFFPASDRFLRWISPRRVQTLDATTW